MGDTVLCEAADGRPGRRGIRSPTWQRAARKSSTRFDEEPFFTVEHPRTSCRRPPRSAAA